MYIRRFYCLDCSITYDNTTTYYKKYASLMTDSFVELEPVNAGASTSGASSSKLVSSTSFRGPNKALRGILRYIDAERSAVADHVDSDDNNDIIDNGSSSGSESEKSVEDGSEKDSSKHDSSENNSVGKDSIESGIGAYVVDDGDVEGSAAPSPQIPHRDWYQVEKLVRVGWPDESTERMWLVRWTGFTYQDDIWIAEKYLGSCKAMIDAEATKLGLPLSTLLPVHGCNVRDRSVPVNIAIWVTSARVLDTIRMYRSVPQYRTDLPIIALNGKFLKELPCQNTIYLVSLDSHLYVVYYQVSLKFAWISDGLDLAFKRPSIVPKLSKRLRMRLRSVDCNLQKRVDHCGASAAAIAPEMIRLLKDPSGLLSQSIEFPHSTYEKLVHRIHQGPSASPSGWRSIEHQETRKYCDSCDSFSISKNRDRRVLFRHQRACPGSELN